MAHAETPMNPATSADPVPSASHTAKSNYVLISSHGSRMNGFILMASGAGVHPTLLLLHGLPGSEPNDLAQAARRAGWNVVVPHYRGAWGSEGYFSIGNAVADTAAATDFLYAPANVAKYGIDTHKIVIAGHSTGGYNAGIQASRDRRLAGAILIDAWNAAPLGSAAEIAADEAETRDELTKADFPMLKIESKKVLIDDMLSQAPLVSVARDLATLPILIVGATREGANGQINQKLAAEIMKTNGFELETVMVSTDHGFSDHRIELTNILLNWLDRIKAKP